MYRRVPRPSAPALGLLFTCCTVILFRWVEGMHLSAKGIQEHAGVALEETLWKLWYETGYWGTLQAVSFLMSALFADLLLVRISLCLAYVFALTNLLLGMPPWGEWTHEDHIIRLGSFIWVAITFTFQSWALVALIMDEMPVRMTAEEEEVWRLFYRRCGMAQCEFRQVMGLAQWRQYRAGELVEALAHQEPRLHLIVKGRVCLTTGRDPKPILLASGQVAGLKLGNLFGIYIGFDADYKKVISADTDVTLVSWDTPALMAMANGSRGVALPAYWRSFIMFTMAQDLMLRYQAMPAYNSFGEPEPPGWREGLVPSTDFTRPLNPDELDPVTCKSILRFILGNLNPRPRRGLRHKANPKHGALAQQRALLRHQMEQEDEFVPQALLGPRPLSIFSLEDEEEAESSLRSPLLTSEAGRAGAQPGPASQQDGQV